MVCSPLNYHGLHAYSPLSRGSGPDMWTDRLRRIVLRSSNLTQLYLRIQKTVLKRFQARLIRHLGRRVAFGWGKVSFQLDLTSLHDVMMYRALISGGYEPGVASVIQQVLSPGGTFVDGGANCGLFTVLALAVVGETGHLYAFEPNPTAYVRLEANLLLNGLTPSTVAKRLAIGEQPGSAFLRDSLLEDGRSSVIGYSGSGIKWDRVEVVTLDDVLGASQVDLVKLDVEGAELSALRGMRGVLENNPAAVLIVEWNPTYATNELWTFLTSRFMVFTIPDALHDNLRRAHTIDDVKHRLCNLLCVPASLLRSGTDSLPLDLLRKSLLYPGQEIGELRLSTPLRHS